MQNHTDVRLVVALGIVVGLLACERGSIPLDPPGDAAVSADATPPLDDAGADGGLPDVATDSGPRLFTVRVGTVYGPDPESFVPADLSGYTFSARSALGASTVTVEGPGQLSVWALGRLELTVATRARSLPSYVVSTEASHVDLTFGGLPSSDAPRVSSLRLELELSSPWQASDALLVTSTGGWSAFVEGSGIAEGVTRADLTVEGSGRGRIVGEDLWVVRRRSERTATATVTRRLDEANIPAVTREALSRPLAPRLAPPRGRAARAAWDVSAWQPDGISMPDRATADRFLIRSDRLGGGGFWRCGMLWLSIVDADVLSDALSGTLPEGALGPPGYEVCTAAARRSDGPSVPGIPGIKLLSSEVCDCTSGGGPVRLTLGPIRDLRLDGEPLGPESRTYRAPFRLSWRAPREGVAHGYVAEFDHDDSFLLFVTDRTEVTVPAELIRVGATVLPTVTAIEDATLPPVESPFVRSRRWQRTDWMGGVLRPAP